MPERKICQEQRGPSEGAQDDVTSETDQTLGLAGGTAGANREGGIGGANREGGEGGANRAGGSGGANLAGGTPGGNPAEGDYGERVPPRSKQPAESCEEEPVATGSRVTPE
jgi:hypothetical protein